MSTAQKLIKYGAIVFAIFIIINIIGAIYFGLSTFSGVLGLHHSSTEIKDLHNVELKNKDYSILKLDLASANVTIKKGNDIKVQTNSNDITCKERGNSLLIKEKEMHWFNRVKNKELIVYLPEVLFDEVIIETGAGKILVEEINTKRLDFDLGAGKADIKKLNVSNEADFDGGAGEVQILSGSIHNLDLDLGVGRFFLRSSLTGNTKIDAGVGEVDIHVLGVEEDYRVKVSKGLGSLRLNGESIKNDTTYGSGDHYIDVDGGVGSLSLTFEK